jgi:hypothetical protein
MSWTSPDGLEPINHVGVGTWSAEGVDFAIPIGKCLCVRAYGCVCTCIRFSNYIIFIFSLYNATSS